MENPYSRGMVSVFVTEFAQCLLGPQYESNLPKVLASRDDEPASEGVHLTRN